MAAQARTRGFQIIEERRLSYDPERGAYRYRTRSSLDISDRYAATTLWLDGDSGELLNFQAATGDNMGNTLSSWLFNLHFDHVAKFGIAYRAFVCLLGLCVALLSASGVWIWLAKWKKRTA
jgi:uncharacterized iron-regulated membrane protein